MNHEPEYNDENCEVCGMDLTITDETSEDSPEFQGFCSTPCQEGYEHWQELCAATEVGVCVSPKLWRPPCVRPMFDFLCAELQCGRGDGVNDYIELWSRSIYDGTDCGAWLDIPHYDAVRIGSIVEGADQCADSVELLWPFTSKEFWAAVQNVEDQCDAIWQETHGCDKCFELTGIEGLVATSCPECGGEGIPI